MSEEGEKTCPLCAEEMDLTDQQLKPCKCGYEICVWCWHHIMDMAEKDETEGRCPACRTCYDKERVVGTASKCERLVAEINMEKKLKSQKAKMKTSDGRKQLSSVRVIQRNLVYIVGLPLNLADEELLIGREYFGQYGKVSKVSISRTSAGTIQQFPNNSCSVYITYSKEDEAVRCIQSVHGFNLEGRSLRACFGTTKYCHSWLRNVPCTNPECLYLHDVGSTEDSFTKDEIISAYSRVQQITGISNNVQRRSGTVLPPPADECTPNGSSMTEKPAVKSATNNLEINLGVPSPASGAGRPGVLPPAASWGTRASNCQSSGGSAVYSNGATKQKLVMSSGPPLEPSAMADVTTTGTLSTDVGRHVKSNEDTNSREPNGRLELPEHVKRQDSTIPRSCVLDNSCTSAESSRMVSIGRIPSPSRTLDSSKLVDRANEHTNTASLKDRSVTADRKIDKTSCEPVRNDKMLDCEDSGVRRPIGLGLMDRAVIADRKTNRTSSEFNKNEELRACEDYRVRRPSGLGIKDRAVNADRKIDNNSYDSMKNDRAVHADRKTDKNSYDSVKNDMLLDFEDSDMRRLSGLSHRNQGIELHRDPENLQEHSTPSVSCKNETTTDSGVSNEASTWQSGMQASGMKDLPSEIEDIDGQQPSDAAVSHMRTSISFPHLNNLPGLPPSNDVDGVVSLGVNPPSLYNQADGFSSNSESNQSSGYLDSYINRSSGIGRSSLVSNDGFENHLRRPGDAEFDSGTDAIENSIISNILSLDLDSWDESLTSPQNLAKLLGEPERQQGPVRMPNSWKPQNSNQSRFSFARQESRSQVLDPEPSVSRDVINTRSFPPVFVENRDPGLDRLVNGYGVPYNHFETYESFPSNQSVFSTSKFNAPRAQISAPPGFSALSRPPPPGFSVHDKTELSSGNHILDTSSLHKNQYQATPITNPNIAADIEFIDPAILAVGKGVISSGLSSSNLGGRPNFSSHTSAFENDSRLQLLMQRTLGAHQNQRYGDIQDHYSLNNAYGFTPRHIEPSQTSNNMSSYSQFPFQQPRNGEISNAHYDAWPDVHGGNNIGLDLFRSDRLGFNKLYGSHGDFQAPNAGDVYSRQFGM